MRVDADAGAVLFRHKILREGELSVARIPPEQAGRRDVFFPDPRIVGKAVFGGYLPVGGEQFGEGKSLRRLQREQPLALHGFRNKSALRAHGGIRAGQGAHGAAVLPHRSDAVRDDLLRNKRAGTVVDEHIVGRAGEGGEHFERVFHGGGARCSPFGEFHLCERGEKGGNFRAVGFVRADEDAGDLFVRAEGGDRPFENGNAADLLQQFILLKSRARAGARRGDNGVDLRHDVFSDFYFPAFRKNFSACP